MVHLSKHVLAITAGLAIVHAHPQGSFHFGSINPAWVVKRALYNLDGITDADRRAKLTQGLKDAVTIAAKALEKMGDPKYRPASLEFWFGSEHNNDASFAKIRGVFDNFVGQNTDGTGSDRLGQTTVRNEDYWVPSTDEGGDGTTMFCSIVKDGKTAAAYFKTFESKAAMHFCDKVFDRGNLEALTANNCANVGDQISTKKWTKNFIGANVLHEFMHNPRIGRDAALKRIGDVAYGAWLCRQLAIDQDIERRKKTIYNADTYVYYALDIAFQENCGRSFSEPRDESGDTDNAADNGVADSDPESDDPTNGACDCGESSCTPDSRACCANGSCLPLED